MKTTNDVDGIFRWFNIYGNPKFNIVKECSWRIPQNIKGKVYKSIIVFSNYDENGTRINDLGFLCNSVSDIRVNSAVESNSVTSIAGISGTYQVVAQKAYFYDMTENGASRRKGYLVEGEKINILKEKDGFGYCEFTNSITKKTSKGWIEKECLELPNSNLPTEKLVNSPYTSLLKFDGEYTHEVNFFKQPIIRVW